MSEFNKRNGPIVELTRPGVDHFWPDPLRPRRRTPAHLCTNRNIAAFVPDPCTDRAVPENHHVQSLVFRRVAVFWQPDNGTTQWVPHCSCLDFLAVAFRCECCRPAPS